MARRHAPGGRAGGGAGLATVRTRGTRLAATAAAAALAGGVGAWIAAGTGRWGWPLAGLAAFAVVLICLGAAPAWPPALLGAEYAVALEAAGHARVDGRAAAVAAALVVVVELTAWARELRPEIAHERGLLGPHLWRVVFLGIGAAAAGAAVVALAAAPLDLGLAGDALGAAAAVGALGLATRLAGHQH